jgi:RHS repeat-associated protein
MCFTYTGFNKVSSIDGYMAGGVPRTLEITYGPTRERKQSVLLYNQRALKTITYAGDFEVVQGNMRYYIYGGNGLAAIYTKTSGTLPPNAPPPLLALYAPKIYYVHTDHLGSIVKLTEGDGTTVFKASYDAWGKQKITTNTFTCYRGYTGHEHIPEFGLINMNGRMYDPVLGRFLSPDPYVQAPDFSQNFNRYSYCLNNPLKYTDPSGEFFLFTLMFEWTKTFVNTTFNVFKTALFDGGLDPFSKTARKNAWDDFAADLNELLMILNSQLK